MPRVLLTGASGFVGRDILRRIATDSRFDTRRAIFRNMTTDVPVGVEPVTISALEKSDQWKKALSDIDVVIHAAARAHIMDKAGRNQLTLFRETNVVGTEGLASQAADMGVQHFIFISTVGVNGITSDKTPFTERSAISPHSPYAISKYEAETKLREIEARSNMSVTIIRPPLIYGRNPKGNIALLLDAIYRRIPFPFALVNNKRTMLSLENLTDLILTCIFNLRARRETFLVGDSDDVSTPELITLLARGMNRKVILLPVPPVLLQVATKAIRKEELFHQLCDSLMINSEKCRRLLNWTPPVQAREGLIELGSWYSRTKQKND